MSSVRFLGAIAYLGLILEAKHHAEGVIHALNSCTSSSVINLVSCIVQIDETYLAGVMIRCILGVSSIIGIAALSYYLVADFLRKSRDPGHP